MTENKLSDRVRKFLDVHFSGSSIDDGYYFVSIAPRAVRRVKDDPFELLQRVADRISEQSFWVISVGTDPRHFVDAREAEERTVIYTPDWNIEQKLTEHVVAAAAGKVDLYAMLSSLAQPAALVFIDPIRRIILDARMRHLFAPSEADLTAFVEGINDLVVSL